MLFSIGDLHRMLEQCAIGTAAHRLPGTESFHRQAAVVTHDEGRLTSGDGGQEARYSAKPPPIYVAQGAARGMQYQP
jgi:hypothetical protein